MPLYLAKEHGMDLKQIAMFAGCRSGRRSRQRGKRLPHPSVYPPVWLLPRQLRGGKLRHRRVPDDLSGRRRHYPRPVHHHRADLHRRFRASDHLLHAQRPVVESFDKGQMATVNGMRGSAAWIASFLFSLLIGVTADKIGFNPLFIAMGFFDLIGAVFWWHLLLNVAPSAPDSGCIAYENPENWTVDKQSANHLELLVDNQHRLCLYVLEENLFRVLIKRKGELALDRTEHRSGRRCAVGRPSSRRSERLHLPCRTLSQQDEGLTIATEQLRVTVHQPLWLEWHYRNDAGEWQPLVNDRPTSAYLLNAHGDGVAHYLSRRRTSVLRLGESGRPAAQR